MFGSSVLRVWCFALILLKAWKIASAIAALSDGDLRMCVSAATSSILQGYITNFVSLALNCSQFFFLIEC